MAHSTASLRKSPSMAELDELLRRRSRAKGRPRGQCSYICDIVQPKWSVIYAGGSACSVSMKPA